MSNISELGFARFEDFYFAIQIQTIKQKSRGGLPYHDFDFLENKYQMYFFEHRKTTIEFILLHYFHEERHLKKSLNRYFLYVFQ